MEVGPVHPANHDITYTKYIKGGERVSNGAYANGEHRWVSNVTSDAVHVIKY